MKMGDALVGSIYLEVARPALLFLAKQSCDDSSLTINDVIIHCTNSRVNLDDQNLLVNYFLPHPSPSRSQVKVEVEGLDLGLG